MRDFCQYLQFLSLITAGSAFAAADSVIIHTADKPRINELSQVSDTFSINIWHNSKLLMQGSRQGKLHYIFCDYVL